MIEIEDIEMYIYWTTCALRSKAASSPGHTHLAIFLSDKWLQRHAICSLEKYFQIVDEQTYPSLQQTILEQIDFNFCITLISFEPKLAWTVSCNIPGVPTRFRQEFSLKISKFRSGEKTRESVFTFS